ncbi:MAG: terminase small subunit [Thermoplasmatota archaeon]
MAKKKTSTPSGVRPVPPRNIQSRHFRERFAKHIAAGKSGPDSVMAAGSKSKPASARSFAAKLLAEPAVRAKVEAAHKEAIDYLQVDVNEYLEQLDAICRFDLADCYDDSGRILPIKKMPRRARMALAGMEVILKNAKAGDGVIDEVLKIRQSSKIEALVAMLKVRGDLVNRSEKGKPGDFSKMSSEQVLEKLQKDTLPKLGLKLVKDTA